MQLQTERLIIDSIKAKDKENYFINISHDKKVLQTLICQYAERLNSLTFLHILEGKIYSRSA